MNTELRMREERKRKGNTFCRVFHTSYFTIPTSSTRGFTILFAVLIGSLLFSIGLGIAQLSIKEILLSSSGKESERAFFAADTGIECALYWDILQGKKEQVFPASSNDLGRPSIECNGVSEVPIVPVSETPLDAVSSFTLTFARSATEPSGCVLVTVQKTLSGSTIIEARGRNDCEQRANPARVERALRVRY